MKAPSVFNIVLVLSPLVWSPLPASAEVILPDVNYQGFLYVKVWDGAQPLEMDRTSSQPSDELGIVDVTSASASYSSALSPHPMATASASAASFDSRLPASASAVLWLHYYFEATGPGPVVPIHVTASGNGGFLGVSPADAPFSFILTSPGGNWTMDTNFDVSVGRVYDVFLDVEALTSSPGDGLHTASATVDPIFRIDPLFPDASQYQLFFSSGVTNFPVPSTLVLLSSLGMTVLGIGGLRKRLKRTTAA
jgi:hypothetical protein